MSNQSTNNESMSNNDTISNKYTMSSIFINKKIIEPLLVHNENRFVLFPITHHDIWKMAKKHQSSYWPAEEIDLSQDLNDWQKLNKKEQHFIKYILAFFAASDGIVNENLASNFCNEIQISEVRYFYSFQMMMENIHSEMYSILIDTYVKDNEEKTKLFNAIQNFPAIKKKAVWALRWTDPNYASFQERLIAFAVVEGIFFSGAFCSIFWLKKRGMFPGLCMANTQIAKDEGLHTDFAVLLYTKYIINKLSPEKVYEIIKEAVQIECEFITEALPVEIIGMNSTLMQQYIKFVADHLLYDLNYDKLYNVSNPFEWMEMISLQGKTNFFEQRVPEYSMAKIGQDNKDNEFNLNVDF